MTTNYTYGTKNDLLVTTSMGGVTTQTINYTGDGNMANLNPGIQAPGGSLITSLGWNQNARLSAVKSGSNILARYDYDGFGQRVVKTLSASDVTLYQYGQDGMLLEEATYKGVPLADYIYLNGRPIATLMPSGTLYFLHDDLLGTPQLATDSSQNIAWQSTYTPFGQASVSGTLTQNLRLPGQYFDSEGGWSHNGFRNYLPDMGRYMEPEPLALLGTAGYYDPSTGHLKSSYPPQFFSSTANVYDYARNNPTNLIDPLGLNPCKKTPSKDPCANAVLAAAGIDARQQIATAQKYMLNSAGPFGDLAAYYAAVHTGGPNDIKNLSGHSPQNPIDVEAGNISFGITCPFGAGFCQFAAGIAQTLSGNPDFNGTLATGFDTPSDNAAIRIGQAMRAAGCHQ